MRRGAASGACSGRRGAASPSAARSRRRRLPAPPSRPSRRAAATAASSMTPPRATFSRIAPGFIRASSAAPISPRVVRVSGTWTETTSARARRSSNEHELDAVMRGLLRGDVRVRGEDRHLHGPCPGRDRLADLAEPDDPERPAAQLEARELGPLPLAAPDGRVGRRDPSRHAVEEGERVLGGRDRVAGRGVDDGDPGARRGLEVDVVDADPGPADDLEPRARRRSSRRRPGPGSGRSARRSRRGSRRARRGTGPAARRRRAARGDGRRPPSAMGSATRTLTPGRRPRPVPRCDRPRPPRARRRRPRTPRRRPRPA